MTDTLLQGWKEIAGYLRIHPQTAKRYKRKFGMPVCYMPSGKPCISIKMIHQWLLEAERLRQGKL